MIDDNEEIVFDHDDWTVDQGCPLFTSQPLAGDTVMAEQATQTTTERITIENIDLKTAKKADLEGVVREEQERRNSLAGWTIHEHLMVFGSLGLAGCLLAVSIHHLAGGLHERTGIHWWESWCLAIFFDMACVLSKLYLADVVRRLRTHWFIASTATGMIATVFGFSVYLNCIAFGTTGLGQALGWTVPSMVLALSVLGFWKLGEKMGHE